MNTDYLKSKRASFILERPYESCIYGQMTAKGYVCIERQKMYVATNYKDSRESICIGLYDIDIRSDTVTFLNYISDMFHEIIDKEIRNDEEANRKWVEEHKNRLRDSRGHIID
ncbi:hypothetical protein OO184_19845 [Photorhabdus sp. APURE]|uniref:hypothetical protein n=1 Tax=Photorhabdus aballayi TaxID=2991723 RepID=UPI00223E1CF6|nr:hypothetical protein [Photorhabdus aballayi]MCW7550123.1 hypothetical protein [Photorhabdus aballayi]